MPTAHGHGRPERRRNQDKSPLLHSRCPNHVLPDRDEDTTCTPRRLIEAQRCALQTLSLCRTVITTLEMSRVHSSCAGYRRWMSFWEQLYERELYRSLKRAVSASLGQVDDLFRHAAMLLHHDTIQVEGLIMEGAASEEEILGILDDLEFHVRGVRGRTRWQAQMIIEDMRIGIGSIPRPSAHVGDELIDHMKRDIFALDPYCDYHPDMVR